MKQSSKTAGLLLEIIISIVFLSCICVVTLQLFYTTQQAARYSGDKSSAIHLAQSVGDMFLSRGDFEILLADQYGDALLVEDAGEYVICLDENLNPAANKKGDCFVVVRLTSAEPTKAGVMRNVLIQVQKQDEFLFDLEVSRYEPGGTS